MVGLLRCLLSMSRFYLFYTTILTVFLTVFSLPLMLLWLVVIVIESLFTSILLVTYIYPHKLFQKIRGKSYKKNQPAKGNIREIAKMIRAIPVKTLPIPSRFSTSLAHLSDIPNYFFDTLKITRCLFYPYPPAFSRETISLGGKISLAGYVGIQLDENRQVKQRPAIIIVHGLFNTKNHNMVRKTALYFYYELGFHVVVPDLRDFGKTLDQCEAVLSGSHYEGLDIIALANMIKSRTGCPTVGLLGFSYGAASVISAAWHNQDNIINGGVMAFAPFADLHEAIEYIDRRPRVLSPFYPLYLFFRLTFLSRVRGRLKTRKVHTMRDYLEQVSAPYYGISADSLIRRSSPQHYINSLNADTLIIHAKDDPVIPVEHSERLARESHNNDRVEVIFLRKGGHFAHQFLQKKWYHETLKEFFTYWFHHHS